VLDELEPGLVALAEELLAAAEQQGVDEQVYRSTRPAAASDWARRALPWTWISPPSVSLSAATSSREDSTVTSPSPQGAVSPARVVETTYLGIAF
jgi:hypothetical protein